MRRPSRFTPEQRARSRKHGVIAILILSFIAAFVFDSDGYELPDRFRKWNVEAIEVYYNTDGCPFDTTGLWTRAAYKWGVLDVVEMGHNSIGYDNRPTLYCAENAALQNVPSDVEVRIDYVRSSQDNLILATAHSYWISEAMVDCDIRLHPAFVYEENIEEAMLHEFGHCLGIAHSQDREAIMYYAIRKGAYLHADDHLAICEIYGVCRLIDSNLNLAIPPQEYGEACYYGYLIAGGIWPDDVVATECGGYGE